MHQVDVLGSICVIMIPRMTIQRMHCLSHNSTFIRTHAKLEVLGLSLNKLEEANKKERTPMLGHGGYII